MDTSLHISPHVMAKTAMIHMAVELVVSPLGFLKIENARRGHSQEVRNTEVMSPVRGFYG